VSNQAVAIMARLTKRYGATVALDSVDLARYPGVTGLLGPDRAGKTTTDCRHTTGAPDLSGTACATGGRSTATARNGSPGAV
jgi:ABC-type multidrug transport system ATPase subunit